MKRIGVLSDIHNFVGNGAKCIDFLRGKDIDMLVLNGDCANTESQLEFLLEQTKGIQTFYQQGGHEGGNTSFIAEAVKMDLLGEKFTFIDVPSIIPNEDNYLLFVPGSDIVSAEGALEQGASGTKKSGLEIIEVGKQVKDDPLLKRYKDAKQQTYFSNQLDMVNLVKGKNPEMITVFNHIPPKFGGYNSVDSAMGDYSGGGILPFEEVAMHANYFKRHGRAIKIEKQNIGNVKFKELCEELGLKKTINGHVHEAIHNAHGFGPAVIKDESGKVTGQDYRKIEEGEWTQDLAFNASCGKFGKCAVVEIDGSKIRFEKYSVPGCKIPEGEKIRLHFVNEYW